MVNFFGAAAATLASRRHCISAAKHGFLDEGEAREYKHRNFVDAVALV